VKEFILRIKNHKVTGYDGISAEVSKLFCVMRVKIEILTNMVNKIKNGREFPRDWKIAIMYPIYKRKGIRRKPGKCRGISLPSMCSKIFCGLLVGSLRHWLINTRLCQFFMQGLLRVKEPGITFLN
jgi:hypothetical protein